jgi:N-formylglutamate amidohydrolase
MMPTLVQGTNPLLISMPHVGTWIGEDYRDRFVERAYLTEDTDWFVDRMFSFASDWGAGLLMPKASRYLIDLNRPSNNRPMYPWRNNTELCPTRFFQESPFTRRVARRARTKSRNGLQIGGLCIMCALGLSCSVSLRFTASQCFLMPTVSRALCPGFSRAPFRT